MFPTAKLEKSAYSSLMHKFIHFWGYMGDTLGMSGDQVGMNGDEGGRGVGGEEIENIYGRFVENK